MKRYTAAIYGGSGFAGAELTRRLLRHPGVELVRVCAADHLGLPLSSAHPNLEGLTDLVFEPLPSPEAAREVDVVLMGLPHDVSARIVDAVVDGPTRVVDMSGAFRLESADSYARYYGTPHPRPDLLGRFVYGLPELNRERIRDAQLVASPGCFATTIELSLLPLARAGALAGSVEVVAVTGSSGSGAEPRPTTHHPTRAHNLRTYRPLSHQHAPEIEETLRHAGARDLSIGFVPVSAPLTRGIFATSFAHLGADVSVERVRGYFEEAYAHEPFVRVPAARLPEVIAVLGSNTAEVGFEVGPASGSQRLVTCFAVTDNLVKGGAGQAIENMNLMLGLDEMTALDDIGLYP